MPRIAPNAQANSSTIQTRSRSKRGQQQAIDAVLSNMGLWSQIVGRTNPKGIDPHSPIFLRQKRAVASTLNKTCQNYFNNPPLDWLTWDEALQEMQETHRSRHLTQNSEENNSSVKLYSIENLWQQFYNGWKLAPKDLKSFQLYVRSHNTGGKTPKPYYAYFYFFLERSSETGKELTQQPLWTVKNFHSTLLFIDAFFKKWQSQTDGINFPTFAKKISTDKAFQPFHQQLTDIVDLCIKHHSLLALKLLCNMGFLSKINFDILLYSNEEETTHSLSLAIKAGILEWIEPLLDRRIQQIKSQENTASNQSELLSELRTFLLMAEVSKDNAAINILKKALSNQGHTARYKDISKTRTMILFDLLFHALYQDNQKMLRWLMEKSRKISLLSELERRRPLEQTPIMAAISLGSMGALNLFLSKGLQMDNSFFREGFNHRPIVDTAFDLAAAMNNTIALKLLYNKSQQIYRRFGASHKKLHEKSLLSALHHTSNDCINFLSKQGIDINNYRLDLRINEGVLSQITPLIFAIALNNEVLFFNLLDLNADVDGVSMNNCTALMVAAYFNRTSMTEHLLQRSSLIDFKNNDGVTALTYACVKNFPGIVKILLEHGAKTDIVCKNENLTSTALLQAIERDHLQIVEVFTSQKKGLDNPREDGLSPLMQAASLGRTQMLEMLLAAGAKINIMDKRGKTALVYACESNHPGVVKILLNHQADTKIEYRGTTIAKTALFKAIELNLSNIVEVFISENADIDSINSSGLNPLMMACLLGREEIVTLLLQAKVDINQKSRLGKTALIYACESNHPGVVKILLNHQADTKIEYRGTTIAKTALFKAIELNLSNIVEVFISENADIDSINSSGLNPLMMACLLGREEIVTLLRQAEVDINQKSRLGKTALIYACESNHPGVVKILLKHQADTKIENTEDCIARTALFKAIELNLSNIVEVFISENADIDSIDSSELSPLMMACLFGHEEIVSLLLNAGVNSCLTNSSGETASIYASQRGDEKIVSMLIKSSKKGA